VIGAFWDIWVGFIELFVDEIFVVPIRPRVAQNALSVLSKAHLRFDGRGWRVSLC